MINKRYAVLGLLIEQPDYGYRLRQRMQDRLGSMEIGRGYVYDLLKRLQQEGMVYQSGEERGGNGSTRALYSATDQGVEHFEEWMRASAVMMPWYEELHLKVALSRETDLPRLAELLLWREQQCLSLLSDLEQAATRPSTDRGWARSAAVLVRNGDIEHLQAMVRWLQGARAVMQRAIEEARQRAGGARERH